MKEKKVLITFDSMKHPHSGFYYFGKSLGDSLLIENHGQLDLTYYVSKKSDYHFNKQTQLCFHSPFHRIYFPVNSEFDLTHFTDQYCRLKPYKVRGKKILTIHDLNPIHEKRKSANKIQRHINKLTRYVNECNYIVAISKFVAADIAQHIPAAKGKIKVIYNGADKLTVPNGHIPQYLPPDKFLFTIGFVAPKKNFHVLPALLQNNHLILVIAGVETAYKEKIMTEAAKFGCQDRVVITGPVSDDDKSWYYSNCEAFVFPSIAEGFGLPVIEAMHFGKPVFLSTKTSLPEIGGDKAFYFNTFEPENMLNTYNKGMLTYNNTPSLKEEIIKHAETFSWQNTAREYLNLYAQCLAE